MKLALVSYNIMFGHDTRVFESLRRIRQESKDATHVIVALQEVRDKDSKQTLAGKIQKLFPGFSASLFTHDQPSLYDLGLMTISSAKLLDSEKLLLPKNPKKRLTPLRLYRKMMPSHGALITRYKIGKRVIRITNLHLNVTGGLKLKRKQMQSICAALDAKKADYDIVAGDFNTIGPIKIMKRRVQKQKQLVSNYLGSTFTEVPVPTWTSDVADVICPIIPANKLIHRAFKLAHISFRQKLDWIFVRGLTPGTSNVRHDLKGSDHYPVFATLHT